MFVGFSAPFCGQLNIEQQAALYHKTTVQITYFVSSPRTREREGERQLRGLTRAELCGIRRAGYRWISVVAPLAQVRPVVCDLLDSLWATCLPDMGTADDKTRSICIISGVEILLRFLWRHG